MSGNTSKNKGIGEGMPAWYAAGIGHVWLPYAQMKTANPPLAVRATQGSRIMLADGGELIDGIASWWTACHGYNHPHIRAAIEKQLAAMPHVMFGGMVHEPALVLAQRLTAMLGNDLDRVFFSDSGSVAVEVALKMAVQYWRNRGACTRAIANRSPPATARSKPCSVRCRRAPIRAICLRPVSLSAKPSAPPEPSPSTIAPKPIACSAWT